MNLTFLGTGTSFGVPVVGCRCATCTSEDPRDRRTRHGALLEVEEGRLLVDTPPELRLQLLRAEVTSVDTLWVTHTHADHVAGLDDLRIFTARRGKPLPAHVARAHVDDLTSRFRYIFDPEVVPPRGTTKPEIDVHPFDEGRPVAALGREFIPLRVPHGPVDVFGFRVGGLGYVTDGKRLPPATLERLRGVRVLVLNALWFGNPHPTHFNVEEAVEAARAVGAERTFLVHLTHRVRHQEMLDRLPEGVEPAYDGLSVDIPDP
jgi:phosphoribosyl 1,2-cyclic phosphate phosphodiesterase